MICFECGQNKEKDKFTKGRRICKTCEYAHVKQYRILNAEKWKEQRKRVREKRKEKQKEYYRRWYAKNGRNRSEDYRKVIYEWAVRNKEKVLAARKLREYMERNNIIRPSICSICGVEGYIVGHHFDYSKPLEVTWVCASCHKNIHNGTVLDILK